MIDPFDYISAVRPDSDVAIVHQPDGTPKFVLVGADGGELGYRMRDGRSAQIAAAVAHGWHPYVEELPKPIARESTGYDAAYAGSGLPLEDLS